MGQAQHAAHGGILASRSVIFAAVLATFSDRGCWMSVRSRIGCSGRIDWPPGRRLLPHRHAAGDAARGKTLGYTCLGCHGIENYKNVYPTYSVPRAARPACRIHRRGAEGLQGRRARPRHHARACVDAVGPGHAGHRRLPRRRSHQAGAQPRRTPPACRPPWPPAGLPWS